jgi:hypothetical protein
MNSAKETLYRYDFPARPVMPEAAIPLAGVRAGCIQKIIRIIAIFGFVHETYRI